MSEKKHKKGPTSFRVPQPKKLGLAVPPLLRLPHEELIRPNQQSNESESSHRQPSSALPSSYHTSAKAIEISDAESASPADLDLPKTARLAKLDALAMQNVRPANSASLANSARLVVQPDSISLMDSLPENAGFTKVHHQIVDNLYAKLSTKEQVVHLQLYRLSWGRGFANCFITRTKLARRSNLSPRSTADALTLLEAKGLIRRVAFVTGKGKEQGVEYWVAPAPALAKSASLANYASPAKSASLAKSEPIKEYKEEIHEEHTHTKKLWVWARGLRRRSAFGMRSICAEPVRE